MATCKDVVDLALEYISEEMGTVRKSRLEQHLIRCPSCLNFLRTYQAVPIVTREVLHAEMPSLVKETLRDFLRQELLDQDT